MADVPGPPTPKHPIALTCHYLFKILAVVWYWIAGPIIGAGFVINFVVSIVLLALDFWITKNVTGRKLVGLRWWNEANATGSAWRFETLPEGARVVNVHEKRMFWIAMMLSTAHWAAATILAIFSLSKYISVAVIGVLFNASNMYGYFKCSREAQADLQSYMQSGSNALLKHALTNQLNNVMGAGNAGHAAGAGAGGAAGRV